MATMIYKPAPIQVTNISITINGVTLNAKDLKILPDEHFERTSKGKNWGGKWRCCYCKVAGYPPPPAYAASAKTWWGNRHGFNCKKRQHIIEEHPFA